MARAELYLLVARLARGFEMELYETESEEVSFVHDYHVVMPKAGSTGVKLRARVVE